MKSVHRNLFVCIGLLFAFAAIGQSQRSASNSPDKSPSPEQRAARAFEAARGNPLDLRAFLVRMPKGADLHNHLSGAVYAESWIRAASEDQLCINLAALAFSRPQNKPASTTAQPDCGEGKVPASQAFRDQHLYDSLIDSFSMRGFVPSSGITGHDHFFDTFGKFGGTDSRHTGDWLDEVATRAARQNEQYLELMVTPGFPRAAALAKEVAWREDFASMREEYLSKGLRDDIAVARAYIDQAEATRLRRENCGQTSPSPACDVQLRFLYQGLRGAPKEQVFAQTLLGFEIALADGRFVGINFVQPEDGYISMSDYNLHMRIFGFLHELYPKIHISLHAGELAPGMVPPEGLCCHIRLAIEVAHAERIGHGVDVMYEDDPQSLMKEMAAKHVMVEVNVSSNDMILGIRGKDHPLPIYKENGIPVALSTDDEGVSRIDLTNEYVRAAEDFGLKYADLKQMARTSLEHSFLPGASLWRAQDVFTHTMPACSEEAIGARKPSATCSAFLQASEKARQQWELERRFHAFEDSFR
jgi:adenosine deaminase